MTPERLTVKIKGFKYILIAHTHLTSAVGMAMLKLMYPEIDSPGPHRFSTSDLESIFGDLPILFRGVDRVEFESLHHYDHWEGDMISTSYEYRFTPVKKEVI